MLPETPSPRVASDTHAAAPQADFDGPLVDAARHEVATTASRRVRRAADWLAAVRFMIGAGHHPDANATTVKVAEDLAARMPRSKDGHIAYGRDGMIARLGLGRSTITKHTKVLRELGLLVWVEHGTRANVLRRRVNFQAGDGYKATATIFAAVAPPAWDEAMGRRLSGTGYRARVIGVTETGHARAVREARRAARCRRGTAPRRPVRRAAWPPSCGSPTTTSTPQVEEKKTNTAHSAQTPSRPSRHTRRTTGTGRPSQPAPEGSTGRTAAQVAADIEVARWVRPRVPWLQRLTLRRLAYLLRPLIDAGLDEPGIAATLTAWSWTWTRSWRPADPAAWLVAQLRKGRGLPADRAEDDPCGCGCGGQVVATAPTPAFLTVLRKLGHAPDAAEDPDAVPALVAGDPAAEAAWRARQAREIRQAIVESLRSAGAAPRPAPWMTFGQWLEHVG